VGPVGPGPASGKKRFIFFSSFFFLFFFFALLLVFSWTGWCKEDAFQSAERGREAWAFLVVCGFSEKKKKKKKKKLTVWSLENENRSTFVLLHLRRGDEESGVTR
jgi:hypothetical protein